MYPQFSSQIQAASRRFGIPPEILEAVIGQESAGDYRAVSPAGASGLMQIMPGTYSDLRGRYPDLGEDIFDPASNIMAGAAYLSEMGDRYGQDPQRMLIGYNAGPARADRFEGDVSTLPQETQGYLEALMPFFQQPLPAQDVGYAPGVVPQGIMGPPPQQTALNIPPMATGAPAMLPTGQAPASPTFGDSLSAFISDNPIALMMMGMNMLGAGETGQNPYAAGAQGYFSGMQMDQAAAERQRQEQQREALQGLLAQSGMDPATAQLAGMFPGQAIGPLLEAQFAGQGGPFEGAGIEAQMYNQYVELQRRQAAGEQLSPDEMFMMQLAERHLTQPRVTGTPETGFTQLNPPALPVMGQPQGIMGPAAPETALTAPPAPTPQEAGQVQQLTEGEGPDRFAPGEMFGRIALLDSAVPDFHSAAQRFFPEGFDGPFNRELAFATALNAPSTEAMAVNQEMERAFRAALYTVTGAQATDAEVSGFMRNYGIGWRDSAESARAKLQAFDRYIQSVRSFAVNPMGDVPQPPTLEDVMAPTAPRTGQDIIQQYGLE